MKNIFAFLLLIISVNAAAQVSTTSFTFSTDSLRYGPEIEDKKSHAQAVVAVIVKSNDFITTYDFWFHCTNGSSYVDTQRFRINKELINTEFLPSTKMYYTSDEKGNDCIVVIDESLTLAIVYNHGDYKDAMYFIK